MPQLNRPFGYHNQAPIPMHTKRFYECGCCGAMHSADWFGDCRQDNARFDIEDLDKLFGPEWIEIDSGDA